MNVERFGITAYLGRRFGRWRAWKTFFSIALVSGAASLFSESDIDGPEHRLQMFDGSTLHGRLVSLSREDGLHWAHPAAEDELRFSLANLSWIHFNHPHISKVEAAKESECRFRFVNGDEIYGRLLSMTEDRIGLRTWFGGELTTARNAIETIAFLKNGYSVLYEGPNNMSEWVRGKNPNGWSYRDGVLSVKDRGIIGRDFGLEDSSSIAFDLEWQGTFQLNVTLHTSVLDRYDYSRGAYMFFLSPSYVSLQRVQPGTGVVTLGQTRLTNLVGRSRIRFDLRTYRETSELALLADGGLVGHWRDSRGFVGEGSGAVFSSQVNGASFSIGNLAVTEWDGSHDWEYSEQAAAADDELFLVNRDRPRGSIHGLGSGQMRFSIRNRTDVNIPLDRIKQILFKKQEMLPDDRPPDEIRAYVAGGGSISFKLTEWNADRVIGDSRNFGSLEFRPDSIRQVQFNLSRHDDRRTGGASQADDIWDFDEMP